VILLVLQTPSDLSETLALHDAIAEVLRQLSNQLDQGIDASPLLAQSDIYDPVQELIRNALHALGKSMQEDKRCTCASR
jgi:hypothetical protein